MGVFTSAKLRSVPLIFLIIMFEPLALFSPGKSIGFVVCDPIISLSTTTLLLKYNVVPMIMPSPTWPIIFVIPANPSRSFLE